VIKTKVNDLWKVLLAWSRGRERKKHGLWKLDLECMPSYEFTKKYAREVLQIGINDFNYV